MAYIKHCPWNWTDLSHSPVRWRRANRRQRPPPTSEKASISSGIRLTWGHRRRRRCEDTDGTPVCDWLKRSVSPSDVSAGEGRTFFWDNCARHCWDTATGSTHFLQSTPETYVHKSELSGSPIIRWSSIWPIICLYVIRLPVSVHNQSITCPPTRAWHCCQIKSRTIV